VSVHTPFTVTAFQTLEPFTLLGGAASAMGKRKFLKRRKGIVQRHNVNHITVEGNGPFPYELDGDDLGDAENLEVDYEPDALSVVLP
jgi:hypothetical protein